MLTLGFLWFRTMANSRPSGEKAGTKAPLDLTGWHGGVRRDMGYVLVAHCILYPTELKGKKNSPFSSICLVFKFTILNVSNYIYSRRVLLLQQYVHSP